MSLTDLARTAAGTFAATGSIAALPAQVRTRLFDRVAEGDAGIRDAAAGIIARVRREGDAALRRLAEELDGVTLDALEVPMTRCHAALDALDGDVRRSLERAASNIAAAHRAALPMPLEIETEPGVLVGRRPDPLQRVGVYAPGGRAAYPSSVLMGVIPARIAGVGEVMLCSPPGADGLPGAVVMAAAALAGASRVFAIGGAGAVAAMAHGTATVPRVDRIVGPGNAWVAEAKLQVSHLVAIDLPAGPSELLVIADATADAEGIAREVFAQAEHDPRAAVIVLALGADTASRVERAIMDALDRQARSGVIAEALATRGAVLTAGDVQEAVHFANAWAPEHLLLATRDADRLLPSIRNAGTVFVGLSSSVAFGDYMTGANHVLPTGGLARSYSGLSVLDFVRWTSWQQVTPDAAARLAGDVAALAASERLPAHAAAALAWSDRA